MQERRLSNVLQNLFANELLNVYTLASLTAPLFSDSMNERLQRWFHLHWSNSYPLDGDEDGSPGHDA